MMEHCAAIVFEALSGCISAFGTVIDALGAGSWLCAGFAFMAVSRYLLLPLLDKGASIPDVNPRTRTDDLEPVNRPGLMSGPGLPEPPKKEK